MNKNIMLINLKNTALCAILPLLMVACGGPKNTDADDEFTEIDLKMESIEQKLDVMEYQTDSLVLDSLQRDKNSIELSRKIKRYKQGLSKLRVPRDTVRIMAFNKKIGSLVIDSIVNASNIRQQIIKNYQNDYQVLYQEQDKLRARRDSLVKTKSR